MRLSKALKKEGFSLFLSFLIYKVMVQMVFVHSAMLLRGPVKQRP